MSRNTMPRMYEIRDLLSDPELPNSFFRNFDVSIAEIAVKRKIFTDLEAELQGLDDAAWNYLKHQVAPLFERRNPPRGWQATFDKLNQAKAYNHLARSGCTDVEFVEESTQPGAKTPDLQAMQGPDKVLCEVKTINPSDVEAVARTTGAARGVQGELQAPFFDKLRSTIETARHQMAGYHAGIARRIVYVILNFDDNLHEYVASYAPQLQAFASSSAAEGLEIVFDIKPKFYTATA